MTTESRQAALPGAALVFTHSRGHYHGGTYAHPDLAISYAGWISPAFQLK